MKLRLVLGGEKMKPITEKQMNAIEKLAGITRTTITDVEKLSSFEASKVITALIEKMNTMKQRRNNRNADTKADYKSDALAGLAVKILAQRCKVDEIIGKAEKFRERAVELYKVFDSARQACLA